MSAALAPVADRLLDSLPAIYREADRDAGHGDLKALLGAFESVLLGVPHAETPVGYEQCVAALPSLLSRNRRPGDFDATVRDLFAPWIAARWVAFTPFAHFPPSRLRHIAAGIVPLYARRGTAGYLVALLRLCFDEVTEVTISEHLSGGLLLGSAEIGRTTQLGAARQFTFAVDIQLKARPQDPGERTPQALAAALRAVIDFAKPAHTCCELQLHHAPAQPAPGAHDPYRSSDHA